MTLPNSIDRICTFTRRARASGGRATRQPRGVAVPAEGSRLLRAIAALGVAACAGQLAFAQSNVFLPVYQVVQSGASQAQAELLAMDLGIPATQLSLSNGLVMFIDPTNYLNIPTLPITDPSVISNLLQQTVNQNPSIPINFEQIDFNALSNRSVLDNASALALASFALGDSGLTPQFGTPTVLNTKLRTYLNNSTGGLASTNTQLLDTEVSYQFSDSNGHPFIGPGAQVQVTFDGSGNVTRLLHAARQMSPGPSVRLITPGEAINRVGDLFPPGTQITADVEYYCPPFWWHWPVPCLSCPPPPSYVQFILPYYVLRGTTFATNPVDGQVTSVQSLTQMIPATDDANFVPSLNLFAAAGTNGAVAASVSVVGGAAPYTFAWSGSSGSLPNGNLQSFSYHPVVRLTQPELRITALNSGSPSTGYRYSVQWNGSLNDPASSAWVLESTPDLAGGSNSWTAVSNPVQSSNGVCSVTIEGAPSRMFFRLRLANATIPTTEMVTVTVTDANGVTVQAHQHLSVQATPVQMTAGTSPTNPPGSGSYCSPQWGTESPVDPGLGSKDRADWRARMLVDPGAGTESFLWTFNTAWAGDFIDPAVPHKLGPNPQTSGDDDYRNWGVDSADIVLYIGHGAPPLITFSATPGLWYNNPLLKRSWGDDADVGYHSVDWLCLLSCEVLSNNYAGLTAAQRWGGAFDGLHILTGFKTLAFAGTGFPATFADNMLLGAAPQTVVKSWFNSAKVHGTGLAAALGPIGPGGSLDFNDHYWCHGAVGPTIKAPQIQGWWYVSQ